MPRDWPDLQNPVSFSFENNESKSLKYSWCPSPGLPVVARASYSL